MILDVRKSRLDSGITLVTQAMPDRRSVSIGVWVRTGARDEGREQQGIAHFVEHMMFKGTERRDARAIAASLESLGGHLDAFTTREHVCFSARALTEHLPDAIDVLGDILCRSRFDPAEIEREKSVIREEIDSYEDNPDEKIADLLAEQMWGDHPLGRPILGSTATISAFDPATLREDVSRRYRADQLVIAAAGGIDHDALARLVADHFTPPRGEAPIRSTVPPAFVPTVRHVERDLHQHYVALGTRGLAYEDSRRWALFLLDTLLGGGMSSRLFQRIREEAGLAYSVFSSADLMRDCGTITIHMGVSPDRTREALRLLRDELERLIADGPDEAELASAKAQLRGSITLSQESVTNRMGNVARQELYTARFMPPEEQIARLLAVDRDAVWDLARERLRPEGFALTVLGPARPVGIDESDWPVETGVRRVANG